MEVLSTCANTSDSLQAKIEGFQHLEEGRNGFDAG